VNNAARPGFKKSAEFAEIHRIRWWTIFQKSALFMQKSILFIQNSVKKSESGRSDFFQPAEFLNTAPDAVLGEPFVPFSLL
jgi:hypothetical protein